MLADKSVDLVILDEITYMVSMDYLDLDELVSTLQEMADTVTEIRPVKHAFDAGIQAQQGIDW